MIGEWKIIAAVVLLGVVFGAGYKFGHDATEVQWQKAMEEVRQKAEVERKRLAEENAKLIAKESEHEDEVRKQIKTVYKRIVVHDNASCLDDDGVQIWNSASRAAGQTDKSDDTMRESKHPN